jgi:CheY-like chemotaxis protein
MGTDKYVLVVENDDSTREALKTLLEAAGFCVACAANGREALDLLRRTKFPGAILLDLAMPVMNGWQFRQEQRQDPALALIPVLLLSGEIDLMEQAASLEVAGYFPKPVEVGDLLATLRCLER